MKSLFLSWHLIIARSVKTKSKIITNQTLNNQVLELFTSIGSDFLKLKTCFFSGSCLDEQSVLSG